MFKIYGAGGSDPGFCVFSPYPSAVKRTVMAGPTRSLERCSPWLHDTNRGVITNT